MESNGEDAIMSIRSVLIYVCDNCGKVAKVSDSFEGPGGWETSRPWNRDGFAYMSMSSSGVHSGERCDECITAAEEGRKAGLESRRPSRLAAKGESR